MSKHLKASAIVSFVVLLALPLSRTHAAEPTAQCDASVAVEIADIQAKLDAPGDVSPANLEQAHAMQRALIEDCNGGTPVETLAPTIQKARAALGL